MATDSLIKQTKLLDASGVNQASVSAGGALKVDNSAVTQPVSNAGLTALNGAITGTEVQVDVVGALPAGTNNIGDVDVLSLPSIPAGTNNIGDVDVLSLPALPAGSNSIGTLGANSGVDIGDVTINNASGASAVNIQDGGNSVTVDAPVGTPVFVRLSDGASAISTLPVSLASVPSHAVTNAGTFAVQVDGAALTSLQLADDVVATLGTDTYTEAATKANIIGAVRRDADTTLVNTTNEIAPLQVDARGALKVECFSGETIPVSFTGSGDVATQTTLASVLTSVQLLDDAISTDDTTTHSTGTTKGVNIMGVATPTDTAVNANDLGVVGMTNNREMYVSVRDIAGAAAVTGSGNATGALRVEVANNGTGLITTNPATAANWAIYVEDAGETAGGNLCMAGSVRRDTAAASSGTTGDNSTINTAAEGQLWVTTAPTTTSGLSVANFNSGDTYTALTNSAQVIKASAGNLYGYYIYNPNATATYVMLYNIAAASVTVGTSTAQMVFCIPATSGANLMFPYPISFSNAGWSIAAATTGGGNTAPTTALEAMIWYK